MDFAINLNFIRPFSSLQCGIIWGYEYVALDQGRPSVPGKTLALCQPNTAFDEEPDSTRRKL